MLDEEADETVLGLQVENVELVDPGRNEQERYRVGLRGERRVLDQLDEAVSVDDLPLRDGEVLSWRESFGVGHSHPTLAQIGNQITQAVSHAAATRLQRLAKSRRVRRQKQGRTRRIDQLLDVEHEAMPFGRIGNLPVGFLAKLGGDREIALLKDPEKRVLLPFRRLEAAVGCGAPKFFFGWRRQSPPARCGADPRLRRFLPQPHIQFRGHRCRVHRICHRPGS